MRLVVDNSFCRVEDVTNPDVHDLLKQVFTYQNDIAGEKGQLFFKLKFFKQQEDWKKYYATKAAIKKLEDNEFVCLYKDGVFPTGLLNIALECLNVLQVPYERIELRRVPTPSEILRWSNVPWDPRYYQEEMIKIGLDVGRGVFEAAVGSGKSLVMAYLIKAISCTSLVIVPSQALSGQLYRDFCDWFGASNVKLLDAQKIRKLGKPPAISIVTVQSLGSLVKTGEFAEYAKNIEAVYVDEVHHAGASTYTSLLKDLEHVYYRFGFSGTFLRNDNKTLEMWGFLSNVLYQYPAHRAIEEGYLTPMQVTMHTMESKPNFKYQKEYDSAYCANPQLLDKIAEIVTSYPDKQILILVNKKDKCGLVVHEYLNSIGIENSYISGDNDKDEINDTIAAFNDKQHRVMIGSSVIGEGVDVRSSDHLIMCQGGKSEIAIVQAIGRLIRKYEGKEVGYLHDFRFEGTKYMIKHADEREDIYKRNFGSPIYYA